MNDINEQPMTTGNWFWTLLLLSIPLVNVIFFIIWILGSGNRSRVTYCRAMLLWSLLAFLFYGVFLSIGLI